MTKKSTNYFEILIKVSRKTAIKMLVEREVSFIPMWDYMALMHNLIKHDYSKSILILQKAEQLRNNAFCIADTQYECILDDPAIMDLLENWDNFVKLPIYAQNTIISTLINLYKNRINS